MSICVPTLDGQGKRLWDCLNAIECYTDPALREIVIADCAGALLGYTRPMAAAMGAASGRFLVALNDDVEVSEDWLEPLLVALQTGAWCATPDSDQNGPILLFAPHCMAWTAKAWREIGGLDERFIHHCSDIDIARRLVDAGHPPVRVPTPHPITHHGSASSAGHVKALADICQADLDRYVQKWRVTAEQDKHRLAAALR